MVIVVVALLVSVVLERSAASCWNSSISAYYYTPVHSIFVAALGLIGIALFAIRGETRCEEVLLNGAGFLAPVVAFVPTGWSSTFCPSNLTPASKATVSQLLNGNHFFAKFSSNNLVAFIAGGVFALIVTSFVYLRKRKRLPRELLVPALGSVVVIAAGFVWHRVWPASFGTHAHSYAAIAMFVLVGAVIVSTAARDSSRRYRALYFACAGTMAVGGAVVAIVGAVVEWHHEVLVLELIEITPFVIFWFGQTIQLWDCEPASNWGLSCRSRLG
jgi:hypothetical protein